MKRILFLSFALISVAVSAQVEKGKYFAGGAVDISGSYTGKNSTFNLGDIAAGVYYINVLVGDKKQTLKFIKVK